MTDRDDVLERASESLRELGTPSDEDVARLRARLLASAAGGGKGGGRVLPFAPKRRMRRTLRWVLPLAAALAAGTALAATPSVYATLHGALARALPFAFAPPELPARARVRRPEPRTPAPAPASRAFAPPVEAAAPAAEALAAEAPAMAAVAPVPVRAASVGRAPARAGRVARHEAAASASASVSAPAASASTEDAALAPREPPELAPFRRAQALQLRAHDYGAALAAWDAFLRMAPRGSLALEARSQRALCLVRLGRRREAARALAPFAGGAEAGAYKQAEAHALLEALRELD
jgi:hypothetical protein